jgi:hypothetical protein
MSGTSNGAAAIATIVSAIRNARNLDIDVTSTSAGSRAADSPNGKNRSGGAPVAPKAPVEETEARMRAKRERIATTEMPKAGPP